MHPFYGPNGRLLAGLASGRAPAARGSSGETRAGAESAWVGLVSMAAYLGFWAAALVAGKRLAERYVAALQPGVPGPPGRLDPDAALEILRQRFARGEMGHEEFWAAKDVLDRSRRTGTADPADAADPATPGGTP